jgi:beta-aspartyl-dipeptidase (metallo-type)
VFTLIRGGEVYAPSPLGKPEILVAQGRILAIGQELHAKAKALGSVEVIDADGRFVVPGFIDQHIHFLGGGDYEGPLGRVPELHVSWIAEGGVTTAVGIMGIDMDSKNLHSLLVKAYELERCGLSTYIYTGSFRLPSPYLTTSVRADIVLIEKVLGVKVAIAEDTYPNLSFEELADVAGQLRLAGAMTGKPAVLHCHIGRNPKRLQPLFDLMEAVRFPASQIVPTHMNRWTPETMEHAARFAKMGGTVDFSCNLSRRSGSVTGMNPDEAVKRLRADGVPLSQITLSSDSNVSMPVLGDHDEICGLHNAPPSILHRELLHVMRTCELGLEEALPLVTTNVARVLKLAHKGEIAAGKDADFVLLTSAHEVDSVIARGRVMIAEGKPLVKGPFEERWSPGPEHPAHWR